VFLSPASGGLNHPTFGLSPTQLTQVITFVLAVDEAQPIFQ